MEQIHFGYHSNIQQNLTAIDELSGWMLCIHIYMDTHYWESNMHCRVYESVCVGVSMAVWVQVCKVRRK